MKSSFTVFKVKITPDMINQYVLIPASEEGESAIKSMPENKRIDCKLNYYAHHNLDRHDLFFACIKLVSDNTGQPEYVIKEQVKIDCRWIKGYAYYKDKHGKERCNIITRSISFSEMNLEDANNFYSQAFDILAGYISVTAEVLTAEAKKRMERRI